LITAVAYNYLQNNVDTEDAVMEVFEIILRDLQHHEVNNFKTWVYSVTKHLCLKKLRKNSMEVTNVDQALHNMAADESPKVEAIQLEEQLEKLKQQIEANRPQAVRVEPGTYRCRVISIDEKKSRKTNLGAAAAFLAAVARLPFVAGLDRFLPPVFGSLHPRWRTPWFSLLLQAVLGIVFAFLGQAGTSVKGAYDVLVAMSVITYFIPYLYLFAAMFKLQSDPAGPDVIRVPGGKQIARLVAVVGFMTTAFTIVLSVVPQPDEPNKLLAVEKIVGSTAVVILVGMLIYWLGKKRIRRAAEV